MRRLDKLIWLLSLGLCPVRASVKCAEGFGSSSKTRVIADENINDGYCDCPLDAADEPLTDACSGSTAGGWAGVDGPAERSPYFACPQQPALKLPLSRLNDGVCDCCDGADEKTSATTNSATDCPDICEEVLAEERAMRAKLEKDFAAGYAKRQEELETYQKLVETGKLEMKAIRQELHVVNDSLDEANMALDGFKWESAERRLKVVQEVIASSVLSELVTPLSNDELVSLILHSCQLSGEMEAEDDNDDDEESTCIPLRLAGLDLGLLWGDEDYATGSAELESKLDDASDRTVLAKILDQNARDNEEPVWSPQGLHSSNSDPGRRRLDDYYYDGEFDSMYGDDVPYDDDEDFGNYEPPSRDSRRASSRRRSLSEEDEAKRKEMETQILSTPFSRWRAEFLARGEEIDRVLDEAEETSKNNDDAGEEEGEETQEKASAEAETTPPVMDPMAIPMIRNALSRRREIIQRGVDYAMSATVLLNAVTGDEKTAQARQRLVGLASMTLYHGKIGAGDVWHVLHSSVPEFGADASENEESCRSPLSTMCPTPFVERNGVTLPPLFIRRAAEALCQEATDGEIAVKVCASGNDNDEIPTEIPDGYYGYYLVRPRADDDAMVEPFAPLEKLETNRSGISDLEGKIKTIETNRKSLETKVKDIEDDIGGENGTKYGPNGELHYLRDECLEVEAGKYVYEVCLFGKAAQKEKDGHSSTGLGTWTGMEVNEETGDRLLKWENGQKCWNGPSRSATLHVTCGAETKVVSAEEPDTCRYVLEMESHIACDDALKERLGL